MSEPDETGQAPELADSTDVVPEGDQPVAANDDPDEHEGPGDQLGGTAGPWGGGGG